MSNIHRLDMPIPPEIIDDEFYHILCDLASKHEIKTILEIGSACGEGSTKALYMCMNHDCRLFCIESSKGRFKLLQELYININRVKCYNICSIPLALYMTTDDVTAFYYNHWTKTNEYPLKQILEWLKEELDYIQNNHIPDNGIDKIKQENNIEKFDLVLLDGSAFTAEEELSKVYGARYIALDDTNDIKNWINYEFLTYDSWYELVKENQNLRNGYAIFKRK